MAARVLVLSPSRADVTQFKLNTEGHSDMFVSLHNKILYTGEKKYKCYIIEFKESQLLRC